MGLINNIIACYILSFVLITHGSLLLCFHQQLNQLEVQQQQAITQQVIPQDQALYTCPQIPETILEHSKLWLQIVPEGLQKLYQDIYRMAGVDTVNFLIWIGTVALIGDAILIIYYTLLKPVEVLKNIIGVLIRLLIISFFALFVIYALSQQGILPKYQFLNDLKFLQLDNLYKLVESSSEFLCKKIKQILKKYL